MCVREREKERERVGRDNVRVRERERRYSLTESARPLAINPQTIEV